MPPVPPPDAVGVVPGAAARLGACVGRLARGPGDPTHRRVGLVWWRSSVTPEGGVLVKFAPRGDDVHLSAWGDGAAWAVGQASRLFGVHDDPREFEPVLAAAPHPLLAQVHRRHPDLRVGATDLVCESLLPTIVEQKVTGAEAFRAIRLLTLWFGDRAPGPASNPAHVTHGMRLPLTAAQWARIPSWDYLRAGVEQKRSATVVAAARRASALERTLSSPDAHAALTSLPGVGAWTSGVTRHLAHGDPDAWSVGDYHVPGLIGRALLGRPPVDDAEVVAALEPYAGHRYRVELLVMRAGVAAERHGPRRSLPTHLPTRGGVR